MKKYVKKIVTVLASTTLALSMSGVSAQEHRWVTDTTYVPLRSGKGNQYRIIDKGIKSGNRVTVISSDAEWTEVRTQGGQVGFLPTQFLIDTPTAALKLEAAEAKLSKVEAEYNTLKEQLSEATSASTQLDQELAEANTRVGELQVELAEIKRISANAVSMHERHSELMHSHQVMQTELDVLKAENQRLQSDERNTFFLYGAGSVGLGVIITLLVPALRRRKSYSEWA